MAADLAALRIRAPDSNLGSLMRLAALGQRAGALADVTLAGTGGAGQPALSGLAASPPGEQPPTALGRLGLGRQVYDYFIGRGLPEHQAAAIAGNMAWEGGGRFDATRAGDNYANSGNAPHSFGLAQWNGDRLANLVAFARQNGVEIPQGDLTDASYVRGLGRYLPLQTQLDYAWHEMQGPESRAYRGITGATDLRSAVAGAAGYHRPAGFTWANPYAAHGFSGRESLASQIMGR